MSLQNGGRFSKNSNMHFVSLGALIFVFVLLIGEVMIVIFSSLNETGHNMDFTQVTVWYVIPSFAAMVTAYVIYINYRTFKVSNTLTEALGKVAKGDYDVYLPYARRNSFNAVYANFNKMTDELKSVKTLREDFVHEFSHEFKTPIASINGFANLLLDGGLSPEEQRDILKIIASESARLSRLSEGMLILSKIENQQVIGERKEYRLDLQIKDCFIILEKQWEEKEITISSELPPVIYAGDESLMQQVWLNLISNAVKYTPKHGEVGVTLKQEGKKITVTVSDNGVGIAPENLDKIFEKYYQAGAQSLGNGLGLAICKRICDLCGGEISVESAVGEGTCFTVVLY